MKGVKQITVRFLLWKTSILAVCCSILAATGLDLVLGSGWLASVSFIIGLPLFFHLLATAFRFSIFWRFLLSTAAPASIATFLWQRQVQSGNYRITIGPEIVFVASSLQFVLGSVIIEAMGFITNRYFVTPRRDQLQIESGTEQRAADEAPDELL